MDRTPHPDGVLQILLPAFGTPRADQAAPGPHAALVGALRRPPAPGATAPDTPPAAPPHPGRPAPPDTPTPAARPGRRISGARASGPPSAPQGV